MTDSGGALSHCAIVAREYAIPCVVGTTSGTRRIRDGQWITVDRTAGTVTLEDPWGVVGGPRVARGFGAML